VGEMSETIFSAIPRTQPLIYLVYC